MKPPTVVIFALLLLAVGCDTADNVAAKTQIGLADVNDFVNKSPAGQLIPPEAKHGINLGIVAVAGLITAYTEVRKRQLKQSLENVAARDDLFVRDSPDGNKEFLSISAKTLSPRTKADINMVGTAENAK